MQKEKGTERERKIKDGCKIVWIRDKRLTDNRQPVAKVLEKKMSPTKAQQLCSDYKTIISSPNVPVRKESIEKGVANAMRLIYVKVKSTMHTFKISNSITRIYFSVLTRITVDFYY